MIMMVTLFAPKTKTHFKIPEETITELLADPEALSVILLR